MLEYLHIKNLALVSELEISFGSGLNIVTGETGAGKSLIIGAVQLLAGGRATPGSIRKGEKSCDITGIIYLGACDAQLVAGLQKRLEESGISECEEERLQIRRVITETGSRAYVNGSLVTAGFLKELCENLVDIHGPHDNQTLLLPARQLALLDTFAGLEGQVALLRKVYGELMENKKQRQALKAAGLTPEESDLLQYQLNEIDGAELQADEESLILQRYRLASSARMRLELVQQAQENVCNGENSIAEQLSAQLRFLRKLESLDAEHSRSLIENLEGAVESLQDLGQSLEEYASGLELDEEELQRLETRLELIQKLKRKYGPSLQDVLDTGERIRQRLEAIRTMGKRLQEMEERELALQNEYREQSTALSQARRAAAPGLAEAIQDKLRHLGFLRAAFGIDVKAAPMEATGCDAVEFMFAGNVGEDKQSLRQVASSGEIARVMLAVKTVLSDADRVPILIFDEIDANVGGRVAGAVAEELRAVGRKHQVFSITHLPVVAASGSHHYMVSKSVENERTNTVMQLLDEPARLDEIVRMLGAEAGDTAAVAHARELLKNFKRMV